MNERLRLICIQYSVLLYEWGFLNQKAELLKSIDTNSAIRNSMHFSFFKNHRFRAFEMSRLQ